MLIFLSLFLLMLGGITLGAVPHSLFNLETELATATLRLWAGSVRAFGVAFGLLLLRFSKNSFVRLGTFLWGSYLTLISGLILFRLTEMTPSVNLNGILFLVTIFIISFSIALFSLLELAQLLPKPEPETTPKPAERDLSEIERANQTPTNPS